MKAGHTEIVGVLFCARYFFLSPFFFSSFSLSTPKFYTRNLWILFYVQCVTNRDGAYFLTVVEQRGFSFCYYLEIFKAPVHYLCHIRGMKDEGILKDILCGQRLYMDSKWV